MAWATVVSLSEYLTVRNWYWLRCAGKRENAVLSVKNEIPGGVPGISFCKRMLKYLEELEPCCEDYLNIVNLKKLSFSAKESKLFSEENGCFLHVDAVK